MAKTVTFISGKGGSGKSTVLVGIANELAYAGKRVLIVDTDTGANCLDVITGVGEGAVFHWGDIFSGNCEIADAIYPSRQIENLYVLPAPKEYDKRYHTGILKDLLRLLSVYFDFILIDAPAGLGDNLTLALDHLQDPGNLGTIIRTADWFGVRHIVCSHGTVSCFNPKVVQSTMGGIFRTRIDYTNLTDYLAACGKPVYGALLDGRDIWAADEPLRLPSGGAVLVVGNESRGLSAEVQSTVTHRVAIPNLGGTAESLNAAVACALLMAEFMRGV